MKKTLLIILIVIGIVAAGVSWERFKYGECKKVGHSTLYCVLQINSK